MEDVFLLIPVWMVVLGVLLAFGLIGFLIFFLIFSRDPERKIHTDENHVVSPMDGTVVEVPGIIKLIIQGNELKRLAVYLSLWDVHVNRIPISGIVTCVEYQKGSFFPAKDRKSSERNESCLVGIQGRKGTLYVKQIAGFFARRIVCRLRVGDSVSQGERYGRILFGSRVEVFFPSEVHVRVSLQDRVKAGQTILGTFKP